MPDPDPSPTWCALKVVAVVRRAVVVTGLLVTVLLGAAAPAAAHSELKGSSPTNGARLTEPPRKVRLTFNQDIAPQFARLTITVGKSAPHSLSARVDGTRVVADVRQSLTSAGQRMVSWTLGYRVVSADGHPITGEVRFTAPRGWPRPESETTQESRPDPTSSSQALEEGSGRPAAAPNPSGENSSILAVVIIGGLTAGSTAAAVAWLALRRKGAPE